MVDSAHEWRKWKRMFWQSCQINTQKWPFNWGGRGDDIVWIKRKISYILAKISFRWSNFERGWKEILLFKDLQSHETEWGFRASICDYCKSPVLSKIFVEHINQCKEIHAKMNWQYCDTLINYNEIDNHLSVWENKPLHWRNFPKCLFIGYRSTYSDHIKNWEAYVRKWEFWLSSQPENQHL